MSPSQEAKVAVYWLEHSRAQRIVWLLEELQLSYELHIFKRQKNMQADPKLKEIHALGKSPVVIVEKEGAPQSLVLAESGFIVEYLIEHFGDSATIQNYELSKSDQQGSESWRKQRYFMHYVEGSFMPFLHIEAVVSNIRNAPVPFFIKPVTKMISDRVHQGYLDHNLQTHLRFLESEIGENQYLCGDKLSGPDFLILYPLQVLDVTGLLNKKDYPNLMGYLLRLQNRDAYQRAVAKIETAGASVGPLPRM
ncbi:bifunctional glutathione transferase/peroxidase [Ophidiomyces ophidiicola]|nr:bifunctional glutathione transferase/peroxidase [Ophidiomyces ophidiicola]KAI1956375.1 bifunctional glutathione transferase/peroxidase [Ophidiomyces ophidiicola]